MNQNINFVKIIETTKGDLKVDEVIGSFKHILIHQILSPVFNQGQPLPSNRPVNLQNYSFHLNKPLTLQNASLTAGLIDHQLQNLVQASGCTHNQILIMDGSRYEQKLVQLYDKYTIVKGYTYRLGGNQIAEVLLSYEHILKQIEYEFKLGNGKFKPGYIGEIQLSQTQQINMYFSAFKAYLTFSERTGCPIIINSLQLGQKAVSVQQGGHKNTINKSEFSSQLFSIWQKVISLQTIVKPLKQSKIVLYNIPLIFESHIDQQSFTHRTYCKVHEQVLQLLQEHSIYLGFDLLRYSQVKYAIDYIALLANNFPTKIILSNGLKYKTDLTSFSGEGYLLNSQKSEISQLYKWVSNNLKGQNIFKQVIFENKWRLLTWKSKAEQLQIVATWDCNKCGLVQSEKIEKFRKFGKQFCSIKCLKSYNA